MPKKSDVIALSSLADGHHGLSRTKADALVEAATVCLDHHRHASGVSLMVSGSHTAEHVLEHVTTSDVGSAWIDWSDTANFLDIDPSTAADFLAETVVGLSESTIRRRAVTLSSWHAKLKAETGSTFDSE